MDRKTIMKKKNIQRKFLLFLIGVSTLFMSIGYASINSVSFDITGTAEANKQEGIFITDYKYVSDVNADLENSKIDNIYQSTMKSNISLSNTDPNSSITYEITIYNSTDYDCIFEEVEYLVGNETYSNENITFTLNNLTDKTILNSKKYITFNITFSYKNTIDITNNNLTSYLNFKFKLAPYVVAEYDYTGYSETFTAPHTGEYQIELWGAQGGSYNSSCIGGYGGYSTGSIKLIENQKLYVVVGGKGTSDGTHTYQKGGYNGGGSATPDNDGNTRQASGGGATHIALSDRGILANYENNLSDILIVAGGGGGSAANSAVMCVTSGSGGGINGGNGSMYVEDVRSAIGYGGTQTSAGGYSGKFGINQQFTGSFGQGASGIYSGGGGGLYGGGVEHSSSGGGSGYIGNNLLTNKHMSCYNCGESLEEATKTIHTINTSNEAISDYAKIENGYARITFLKSSN